MNKILITGGCGFIASNFLNYMINKYPKINFVNIDKLDYCSSLKNVKEKPNYKLYIADITNIELMRKIFKIENPNIVVHFAAQSHVDNSFGNSLTFTYNNVYGTHVLLSVVKEMNEGMTERNEQKIIKFIHVSTDEVYGSSDNLNNETSLLNPTNPYSASKAAAEMIVNSFKISFNLPVIITRGNNVYGPRQYPEKLIPKCIMNLKNGKKIPIHGKGEEQRSFIYVDDVIKAFETIIFKGKIGEIYNIGTDFEIKNIDVIKMVCEKMNKKFEDNIIFVENRKFNDIRYNIDNSKLKKLGWEVETDFNEGLDKTIKWYEREGNNNWEE